MQVVPGQVVSFHYTLRSEAGEVLDSSVGKAPLTYLHGYQPLSIAGLEEELSGRDVGQEFAVELAPAQAFGEYDPQKVQLVPREAFPPTTELQEGTRYTATTPEGKPLSFAVVEIQPEEVAVDFNHPLAGQRATLSVMVEGVRHATPEELQQAQAT